MPGTLRGKSYEAVPPGGMGGPIARAWNVHGWPTIYVLDPRGVIQYRGVREKALDTAVDKLLEEMARGQ